MWWLLYYLTSLCSNRLWLRPQPSKAAWTFWGWYRGGRWFDCWWGLAEEYWSMPLVSSFIGEQEQYYGDDTCDQYICMCPNFGEWIYGRLPTATTTICFSKTISRSQHLETLFLCVRQHMLSLWYVPCLFISCLLRTMVEANLTIGVVQGCKRNYGIILSKAISLNLLTKPENEFKMMQSIIMTIGCQDHGSTRCH